MSTTLARAWFACVFAVVLGGFHVVMHRILDIAIDFFGRALYLIDHAFIGELLIADGFANSLLNLSFDLIEFPAYLFGVHAITSLL